MSELPSRHLVPVKAATAAFHPAVWRRGILVPAGGAMLATSGMAALFAATLYAMTPAGAAAAGGTLLAVGLVVTAVLWPILTLLTLTTAAYGRQFMAMRQFEDTARTQAARVIHAADPEKASRLNKLLVNKDSRYAPIRRLTLVRIAETTRLFNEALVHLGEGDKTEARNAYRDALVRIVDESTVETDIVTAHIEADSRFSARQALEDLSFAMNGAGGVRSKALGHALPDLRGDMTAMRIAATGEKVLAIDPEATDAGGNRLDTLIRDHLPRLIVRYGEMMDAPGADPKEARTMLDTGLDLVSRSVEEAGANLRGVKADALRTEIGFLASRRGDSTLTSITDGTAK